MSYTPKPGQMSLFKNDRKEKDTHPDYKGSGLDLQGNEVWVSAWVKDGAKGTFFSISLTKKDARKEGKPESKQQVAFVDDSEIPF